MKHVIYWAIAVFAILFSNGIAASDFNFYLEHQLLIGELGGAIAMLSLGMWFKDVVKPETFEDSIHEFIAFSLPTFKKATAFSSLQKLKTEIKEVEASYISGEFDETVEEYSDCLMCIFDSAARAGIRPDELIKAFRKKLHKNKQRQWKENDDNTYSHVKN